MAELSVIKETPLVVQICLSDGVTEGRNEATEDFAEGIEALCQEYPGRQFQFLPELYRTLEGEDPALVSVLAISL